jgi:dipeptidyl aminopeptidase/acylaminoacyl peptidase
MIIHGEQDTRVPVINAEKMVEQLTLAGNKPIYLSFGRSGHGVFDEAGRKTLYQALLGFLADHID